MPHRTRYAENDQGKYWERMDLKTDRYQTTCLDGPSWQQIWRRETYDLDGGHIIAIDEVPKGRTFLAIKRRKHKQVDHPRWRLPLPPLSGGEASVERSRGCIMRL